MIKNKSELRKACGCTLRFFFFFCVFDRIGLSFSGSLALWLGVSVASSFVAVLILASIAGSYRSSPFVFLDEAMELLTWVRALCKAVSNNHLVSRSGHRRDGFSLKLTSSRIVMMLDIDGFSSRVEDWVCVLGLLSLYYRPFNGMTIACFLAFCCLALPIALPTLEFQVVVDGVGARVVFGDLDERASCWSGCRRPSSVSSKRKPCRLFRS